MGWQEQFQVPCASHDWKSSYLNSWPWEVQSMGSRVSSCPSVLCFLATTAQPGQLLYCLNSRQCLHKQWLQGNWILGKKSSLFFPGFSCSARVGSSLRCTLERGSQALPREVGSFWNFFVLWLCWAGSIVIHASLLHLFHSVVKINETLHWIMNYGLGGPSNHLWVWRK